MSLTPAQAALLGGVNGGLNGYVMSQGGGGAGAGMMGGGMSSLAYSNPYSAAAMVAGQAISSMMGGPDPSVSSGMSGYKNAVDSHLDGSGWTVSTGSSKATSVPTLTSAAQGVATTAAQAMQNPMLLVAAVLLVAVWRNH
ncbi:TPA: hypothetical protein QDB40_000230 [Burkholderia vietnamiensis]|uniref:hypothetical protein n=1 Tax=Burkholderia vietnamiensis TaxID=60552 RepID=UPI00158C387F|nr:hypothetical protein [Burkholderia vietnamiensis]UKV73150.1 hypothetical protein FOC29_04955 [Burkholderia vietnamiensis]HDR9098384.1 hypothetical protein [Burkholderia vietnamiensis]HDR9166328.1 hypothetical protein [Burkholderia vietnamiensis]